uniref:Uncharacterized protein n=1 Tax=Rhizophora mucronata TaxID=61149 RepID=A0A2P2MDE5_RHIMU
MHKNDHSIKKHANTLGGEKKNLKLILPYISRKNKCNCQT